MSTHNICFHGEIRKMSANNIIMFLWKNKQKLMPGYFSVWSCVQVDLVMAKGPFSCIAYLSCNVRKCIFRHMHPAKIQISLCIPAV